MVYTLLAGLVLAPLIVDVTVPLCDSATIACGRGALGDPRSLEGNLYWGARYGTERFLSRDKKFRLISRAPGEGAVLRELVLTRVPSQGEHEVRLVLRAYAGDRIDDALADFISRAAGRTDADVVVWAGHNRLMDVPLPSLPPASRPRAVAVLACASAPYFGSMLRGIGAHPIVLTRTLMAPEAYLLAALASSIAVHGVDDAPAHKRALARSYARYQHISLVAAESIFSDLAN